MQRKKVLILGAAGRDFHDFNVAFRDNADYEVVAMTAAQIPNIAGRRYPPELAGRLYPEGIPIHPEDELEALIERLAVEEVVFAYSDVSHEHVMHLASRAMARGAGFRLLGPRSTMLRSSLPVVSVCAVRTGCGKSPATRRVAALLRAEGLRVAVVRHPMPYGDLARQACQRFATLEDMRRAACTIEEMEEYEPHVAAGGVVYAGVDYERILRRAEQEADVVLWDGGNNDLPFFQPDLEIVLVDPHRAGHELRYYPGETNLLRAHVVVITKVDSADAASLRTVRANVSRLNPDATVIDAAMPVVVDDAELIRGRRALVIEDGPTVTHGGMPHGAGAIAAERSGAAERVDPRPFAVGSIRRTLDAYPHIDRVLPAMGYGAEQLRELEETIAAARADVVVMATPADLRRHIRIAAPVCRVSYELEEVGRPTLYDVIRDFLGKRRVA
jgi:predicted GTPase